AGGDELVAPGLRFLPRFAVICRSKGAKFNEVAVPPERFLNCVPGVRVTPGAPTSRILARLPCRLVHFNATEHPPAGWTARQLAEACGLEESPRNLIR